MIKITDDNYDYYKKVFQVICKYLISLTPVNVSSEYTPDNILDSWEQKSKSLAKRALKESLLDILTVFETNMAHEMRNELNDQLTSQGFPGFNQLVSVIKDTPQKVLKRGKIKNRDEYYVIKEYLDDTTSDISLADRDKLEALFVDFESMHRQKKSNT